MTHPPPSIPSPELPSQGRLGDPRALNLLASLGEHQRDLPRAAALAWERVIFAEALSHPEPQRRIQAFLGEGK